MSLLAQVSRGKIPAPFRAVLHGPEGVGKSTWAANAPGAIFIGAEDGSSQLDVARFPRPASYADVLNQIGALYQEAHEFKTVVLDSADWAELLIQDQVAKDAKVANFADIPYGNGYKVVGERFQQLLGAFSMLRDHRGMNVVILAHSLIRSFNDPTSESFDRYVLATNEKHTSPLLKQWCDALLFADFDKSTVKVGEGFQKRTIAKSYGERVLYTEHRATHDAKNRYRLPERLPMPLENPFAPFWHGFQSFYSEGK